jgi:hypothetical protein
MKGFTYLTTAFLAILPALATPTGSTLQKKADSSKVGYLAVYWTTEDNSVYFALSSNGDALGFKTINGGKPIVSPTLGTKAVRDTSIIAGQGENAGKFYILGTDLNIDAVCPSPFFCEHSRTGLLIGLRQIGRLALAPDPVDYLFGRALTWSLGQMSDW